MKITVSVIKADIGSVGGHTNPSPELLAIVRERVEREKGKLLIDCQVSHTGDDIAILM
ncbi:MAG: fructose 1,6-bisphosphatase, partial [Armatimonadota bacterium]|nr:fructose 1,6-bisphosphatase [Armatimonadota bacterium]MDR5704172.1 fructose 1,6-bisphosphatase [Armatimonadota bacterium]